MSLWNDYVINNDNDVSDAGSSSSSSGSSSVSNSMSNKARELLVDIAIAMEVDKLGVLAEHDVFDMMKSSLLAFFHSVLTFGQNFDSLSSSSSSSLDDDYIPLYRKIEILEAAEREGHVDKVLSSSTSLTPFSSSSSLSLPSSSSSSLLLPPSPSLHYHHHYY